MILGPPRLALLILGVIAPGVDGCNYCGGGNSGCGGNLCVGEGDCDRDSDCAMGLRCGADNCNAFRSPAGWPSNSGGGWDTTDDCCYDPRCGYGYCSPPPPPPFPPPLPPFPPGLAPNPPPPFRISPDCPEWYDPGAYTYPFYYQDDPNADDLPSSLSSYINGFETHGRSYFVGSTSCVQCRSTYRNSRSVQSRVGCAWPRA